MADSPRVVSLPNPEAETLAGAVAELRRKLPGIIEHHKLVARLQRAAYVHYITEGFTEAQAIELIKGMR